MSGLSDGTKGDPMDPHSSQSLATGAGMVEASQSLATGPAAGPTASQTLSSGTVPDYDEGTAGMAGDEPAQRDGGDVAIPNETDDSLPAGGAADMSRRASLQDASRGGYSPSDIEGEDRANPAESGNVDNAD